MPGAASGIVKRSEPGIGTVTFRRSLRARRVVITVSPGSGVRVAVPSRLPLRDAEEFFSGKKAWVRRQLERARKLQECEARLADRVGRLDTARAKQELADRLRQLADARSFSYNKLSFRDQRTRWGSCSARNDISLNIRLAVIPADLADYVMLHELCHTRVHSHSRRFWAEMERQVPGAKAVAARLRKQEFASDL